jgi:eukaryotic-like serine/threonine-protein kinase
MIAPILMSLSRMAEAEAVFARAIELASHRGDRLHLAAALNNRRHLWIGRREAARAVRDLEAKMQIARELGNIVLEYYGEGNLAEIHYHLGDAGRAWPHLRRAIGLEKRHQGDAGPPLASLLGARLCAYEKKAGEARAVLSEITAAQAEARAQGRAEAVFAASDAILLSMVDLATREASREEWEELRLRGDEHLNPVEVAELLEMQGLAALARGERGEAARLLDEALRVASRAPSLIDQRIAATRASVDAPSAPSGDRGRQQNR